jgi:hypothetical protein
MLWGGEPSRSAVFAHADAKEILIPGLGYGRNAKPFLERGMSVTPSVQPPAWHKRFRASVIEMFPALGETFTAVVALRPDVPEARPHVPESATAVGGRLSALGERRAGVISRFTDGVESSGGLGETIAHARQKLIERASPFADVGKKKNGVASPPSPTAPGGRMAGLE